jgi:hypothetical protein
MLLSFPEDARWNAGLKAVEFRVELGEYRGVVRVPPEVFRRLLKHAQTPQGCTEAYHLCRIQFERAAEAKLFTRS